MTLDEAIRIYTDEAMLCAVTKRAKEAELKLKTAKWLQELREYREWAEDEIHSYRDTRKAINDFLGR